MDRSKSRDRERLSNLFSANEVLSSAQPVEQKIVELLGIIENRIQSCLSTFLLVSADSRHRIIPSQRLLERLPKIEPFQVFAPDPSLLSDHEFGIEFHDDLQRLDWLGEIKPVLDDQSLTACWTLPIQTGDRQTGLLVGFSNGNSPTPWECHFIYFVTEVLKNLVDKTTGDSENRGNQPGAFGFNGFHYFMLFSKSTDFVSVVTSRGQLLWANEALQLLRPDLSETSCLSCELLFAAESNQRLVQQAFPEALNHGFWLGETTILDQWNNEIAVSQVIFHNQHADSDAGNFLLFMRTLEAPVSGDIKNQIRKLQDNIPGMVYRYERTAEGVDRMPYVSSKVFEFFEIDQAEATGDVSKLWQRVHPEDLEVAQAALIQSAETLEPLKFEFRVNLPTRGIRWMQTIARPTKFEDGRVVWDGVKLDVTSRRIAVDELRSSNAKLEKATRLKDEFLTNMSHELRTPLNAILGMTEGLQEGVFGPSSKRQIEALETIEQSGNHLLELINEILDLAKIEAGQIDLDYSMVDVEQLCRNSIKFVEPQARQKRIKLAVDFVPDLPAIRVDERRIKQVLINLLNNAVKFTPEEGTIKVTLSPESTADNSGYSLRISVSDNGVGIPQDETERLFEPFVRGASRNSNQDGSGLGLALVKQFVELHRGRVLVESELDEGSCFSIELPYDSYQPESKNHAFVESGTATSQLSPPLVLVAEDDDANVMSLSSYLRAKGFQVEVARNGREAIELANAHRPDVILMDIQMPEVNGIEAIETIRETETEQPIPIIAITALAMDYDRADCLAAGANGYFSKPVKLKKLITEIQSLIIRK